MSSLQRLRIAAMPYSATMEEQRKMTVVVSSNLLEKAQSAARAGKVKFAVHLRELREDRR
jgi:hypothetical protein